MLPLLVHAVPDVALAALDVMRWSLMNDSAAAAVVASVDGLPARDAARVRQELRQHLVQVLSLYNAPDHRDAALQVSELLMAAMPERWSADPQFSVVVVRLAGIEVKLLVDEVESAVAAGVASTTAASPAPSLRRVSKLFGVCCTIIERAVQLLVGYPDSDSDGDESTDASATRGGGGGGGIGGGGGGAPGASVATVRWRDLPAESLLVLRAALEDVVRLCVSSVTGLCGTPEASSAVLAVPELRLIVHACVRVAGTFLAEDSDSFSAELLELLPVAMQLAADGGATDAHSVSDAEPPCLRSPVAQLLPSFVLRTVEPHFLQRFVELDVPARVLAWVDAACRSAMLAAMQRRCSSGVDAAPWLLQLLALVSTAASTLYNVLSSRVRGRDASLFARAVLTPRGPWLRAAHSLGVLVMSSVSVSVSGPPSSLSRPPSSMPAAPQPALGGLCWGVCCLLLQLAVTAGSEAALSAADATLVDVPRRVLPQLLRVPDAGDNDMRTIACALLQSLDPASFPVLAALKQ
jgi:hypothetical protein